MATVSQEKLILDALKISRECDADYPRYVTLIIALNTLIGWTDGNQIYVWINQNKDRWVTLSYVGRLKDKDYQQPFKDENLCCPPTNPIIRKSELPDCEKDASSVTIAYKIGSDNCKISEEKVKAISSFFCNRFPGLTVCFCG